MNHLLLLTLLTITPSYIHPDELIQSPAVLASYPTPPSWEWRADHACRSLAAPLLSSSPLLLLPSASAHPLLALALARVLPLALALLALRAVAALGIAPRRLLASWAFLVLGTRALSNATEAHCLALFFYLLHRRPASPQLGVLVAVAVWVRFTFLLWAFPPWLCVAVVRRHRIKDLVVRPALAALAMAVILVAVDSIHYGRLAVTPLNLLRYNMDAANLAVHGLHAHYTHALVYMPFLFLPLILSLPSPRTWLRPDRRPYTASLAVGLAGLSLAPHQEARFLLPALYPLLMLTKDAPLRFPRLSLAFNALLFIAMGILHQAGVAVLAGRVDAFHGTYMAPSFLLSPMRTNLVAREDGCLANETVAFHAFPHLSTDRIEHKTSLFLPVCTPA